MWKNRLEHLVVGGWCSPIHAITHLDNEFLQVLHFKPCWISVVNVDRNLQHVPVHTSFFFMFLEMEESLTFWEESFILSKYSEHNYPSVNTTLISELAIYFLVSWILIFLMNKEKLRSCSAWAMLKHNLIHIDWENEVIVISMSLFLLDHNMSNTNNMSCYRTYNQNQLQQTKERNPDTWYVKLTNCWMTRVKFPSRIFSTFLQSIILQH